MFWRSVLFACILTAVFGSRRLPVFYPIELSDAAQEFLSPLNVYYCGNEWSKNSSHLTNRGLRLRAGNRTRRFQYDPYPSFS
jgi:hypothetical protein